MSIVSLARRGRRKLSQIRARAAMAAGRTDSSRPLSVHLGFDRGTPVDRHYIEAFLEAHATDIRGVVLEVGDASYSRRFGGNAVAEQHVIDVDRSNPDATLLGDLCDPAVLPTAKFDCIILTQTLHLLYDMREAIAQLHRALMPGGVLLVTVPGISPVRPGSGYQWYWSLTETALRRLLLERYSEDEVTTSTFGNLFAATAFLRGAAVQDVSNDKLAAVDLAYPVTVAARSVRTSVNRQGG